MLSAGPVSTIDGTQLALAIVGGLITIVVTVISKDRKDAKKAPITHEDRIHAGGGDMSLVLGIAQDASARATHADERADHADRRAARAEGQAERAQRRADIAERRVRLITGWAQTLVTEWSTLRLRENPPQLPDLDL